MSTRDIYRRVRSCAPASLASFLRLDFAVFMFPFVALRFRRSTPRLDPLSVLRSTSPFVLTFVALTPGVLRFSPALLVPLFFSIVRSFGPLPRSSALGEHYLRPSATSRLQFRLATLRLAPCERPSDSAFLPRIVTLCW